MDVYALDLKDKTVNPLAKISTLGTILNVVIPLLTLGAGLIFLAMIVFGAFTFLTAGDSAEKVKKAQNTMFSAVLGLFVVVCAYLVTKLLAWVFNIALPI